MEGDIQRMTKMHPALVPGHMTLTVLGLVSPTVVEFPTAEGIS